MLNNQPEIREYIFQNVWYSKAIIEVATSRTVHWYQANFSPFGPVKQNASALIVLRLSKWLPSCDVWRVMPYNWWLDSNTNDIQKHKHRRGEEDTWLLEFNSFIGNFWRIFYVNPLRIYTDNHSLHMPVMSPSSLAARVWPLTTSLVL